MGKIKYILLCALLLSGNAFADTCGKQLTGLFTSFQATKLCDIFGFSQDVTYSAIDFLISADTTDGADTNRIYISGGSSGSQDTGAVMILHGNEHAVQPGHAVLRCGDVAGGLVSIKSAGNQNVQLGTQDTARVVLNGSGSTIHFTNSMDITQNSSDGSDTRATRVSAGGDVDSSRSAHVWIYGNEATSTGGDLYLRSGNVASADVAIDITNSAGDLKILSDGTGKVVFTGEQRIINFTNTMGSSTKSPESDAEDGWIEIKINGTSKYIPYYNAS